MTWTAGCWSALAVALAASGAHADGTAPEQIQLGLSVYSEHCVECHGENAEGAPNWQMPNEGGDLPAPPHDSTGHTWRHADSELIVMIASGWRDPFNRSDELTMPAFAEMLTAAEIEAVIAYLKTLWTAEQQQFQREKTDAERSVRPPVN